MSWTRSLWGGALLTCACGSKPPVKMTTIQFGMVLDLSAIVAAPTRVPAVAVAVTDANAGLAKSASFSGFQFAAVHQDSMNVPTIATAEAYAMVDAGIKLIIAGTNLDVTALLRTDYQLDGGGPLAVPLIGIETSSPYLGNPSTTLHQALGDPWLLATDQDDAGWLFRTSAPSQGLAASMMHIARSYGDAGDVNGDGIFTASIWSANQPLGLLTYALALEIAAPQLAPWGDGADGGQPNLRLFLVDSTLSPSSVDYPGILQQILSTAALDGGLPGAPDVLVESVFPGEAIGMVKQYDTFFAGNAAAPKFLHNQTFHFPQVLAALGAAANGQEGVSFVVADPFTKASPTFLAEYQQLVGAAPQMWDAQAYDAANLAMLAFLYAAHQNKDNDLSKVTPVQLVDALRNINNLNGLLIGGGSDEFQRAADLIAQDKPINYDGASGPCDFDQNGNVVDRVTRYIVVNGQFVDGQIFDCVDDPQACPPSAAAP